MTRTNFA